tara:strand:- start:176 stop:523 length:348 start_codon:yes stop_codon:yes gene_type:complete
LGNELKQVPGLNKNCISNEYILVFGHLDNYIRRIENGEGSRWIKLARRSFLHRPFLLYEEYFPVNEYFDVINDKNKTKIAKLNKIVHSLNEMRLSENTGYDELKILWDQINNIIY